MGSSYYICFSASSHLLAGFFRKILKSNINHCFVIYKSNDWDNWMAIEIDRLGVRLLPAIQVIKSQKHIELYECEDIRKGLIQNQHCIGWAYDWLGLAWGLIRTKLFDWFGLQINRSIHSKDKMFCSEFVTTILNDSNMIEIEDTDTSSISPVKLKEIVSKSNNFKKIECSV